jgi:hypothetical protein
MRQNIPDENVSMPIACLDVNSIVQYALERSSAYESVRCALENCRSSEVNLIVVYCS